MDVRVRRDADEQNVLTLVTDKMSSVVSMLTVQVCIYSLYRKAYVMLFSATFLCFQIVKDAAWHTVEGINAVCVFCCATFRGISRKEISKLFGACVTAILQISRISGRI